MQLNYHKVTAVTSPRREAYGMTEGRGTYKLNSNLARMR
jgi:hypothetical protein